MLRKFLALILLPLLCPAITITRDSSPTIVLNNGARPDEQTAANDLKTYLARMTGADCAIVSEDKAPQSPAIYVGDTAFARKHVPDYDKLQAEELVIKTEGDSLILAGGRPRGCVYATWEFLEREGVVWPSEDCDYAPTKEKITLNDVYVRQRPAIPYRYLITCLNQTGIKPNSFFSHNRSNMQVPGRPEFGGTYHYGSPGQCHTIHAYTSPDWPDEFFALDKNGRRPRSTSGEGPGQICCTNPEVKKAMAAKLREFIAKDRKDKLPEEWPTIYSITQNDNSVYCHCERCQALAEQEGSQAAPPLELINELARGVADEYPEICLYTGAYTWTLPVTKNMKPEPNVILHISKLDCEFNTVGGADTMFDNKHPRNKFYYDNFMAWSKISAHMGVADYWITCYTKAFHPPYLNARNLQKDMVFYHQNNVEEMRVESELPVDTMFTHYRWWFGLKMMNDPYQSYEALTDRFCRAFYGPAAAPMRTLIDYVQDRLEAADIAIGQAKFVKDRTRYAKSRSKAMDDVLPYLDLEFYTKANALLDEAETLAAGNPLMLSHVRMERLPVDICLLNTFSKYADALPAGKLIKPTVEALYQRIHDARMAKVKYFYGGDIYPLSKKTIANEEAKLARLHQNLFGSAELIPQEFQGRTTVIYDADDIKLCSGGHIVVKDLEGLNGKACQLQNSKDAGYHKLPFNMGFCIRGEHNAKHTNLKLSDIHQDGKFHLYYLGRHNVISKGCIWLHWTWLIQCYVDDVYRPDEDNMWDIYASIKFLGEPYVTGSKDEPQVFADKIILAK